jgi:TetR/AcrR family transcriptional regulator, repressor for neighboring sulfatase
MKSGAPEKSPPGIPARRPRRTPEEARRLILDAAQAAIARTGPEGLRLQDIAAAAGISHPLILHHFGSRAGLVRALTLEATVELKDKLVAAMTTTDHALGDQIERVFEAFRGGLAQRIAWLATVDPQGGRDAHIGIMRELAERLHARLAADAPDNTGAREQARYLVHLIAITAFGDAIFGPQLRRSAGIADEGEFERRFRAWFAELIRNRKQP